MSTQKELVIVTFKIPPNLLQELDDFVKKQFVVINRSTFIRDAIKEKLNRENSKGGD